jgi:hypothetical protein
VQDQYYRARWDLWDTRNRTYFISGAGNTITLNAGSVTGAPSATVACVDSNHAGGTLYMIAQLDSVAEPTAANFKATPMQDGSGTAAAHSDTIP